jgi:hypothetical protein
MGPRDVYTNSPQRTIDAAPSVPWKIWNENFHYNDSVFEFPILGRLRRTSGYEPVHELSTLMKIYQSLFGRSTPCSKPGRTRRGVTE